MRRMVMCFLLIAFMPGSAHAVGPATITIASWNIERFGPTKLNDAERLGQIAEVIKEFDVVAIQEITHATGAGQPVVDGLTAVLGSEFRRTYMSILGPRTGCPGGQEEQYAVLLDSEILDVVSFRTIADDPAQTENMCRDPLVVTLRVRDLHATFTFTLVVSHTRPSPAAVLTEDLNALGRIFQTVQADGTEDDDVMLLGDLNADPRHFRGHSSLVCSPPTSPPPSVATSVPLASDQPRCRGLF